jgi:pimeloyl-ACP methyl ester carboxylesterase
MPYTDSDDHRLYHSAWDGDADDEHPPLVLIHGAGGTHLHWPPGLRRLRQTDVYALDLPGHGHSPGPGQETIAGYRDLLLAWADALSLPHFVLAGHSMGGAIAQDLALLAPGRLAGLVLVGSGARLRVHPAILQGVQEDFPAAAKLICDWALSEATSQKNRRQYLRRLLEVDPDVLLGDFRACDAFDVREQLGDIAVPALVIGGLVDRLTPPKYSQYLHERLADAQLVLVENAGHMVMLEQAGQVTEAIAAFVHGLAGRTG